MRRSMPERPQEIGDSWRERLARRLSALSAFLTTLVFAPIVFGTHDPTRRAAMVGVTASLIVGLVWLSRRSTPQRIRAVGVVAAFVLVACTGYATVGFLSAPAAAFAAATVVSGLLLGRRAMSLTICLIVVWVLVVAVLMVKGWISAPGIEDLLPSNPRPWVRTLALTVLLVVIIGAAVTWAVETIESAAKRADDEARRRHEAEANALKAQSRELIGQLSAGLAHDVNNQLTVIRGWSALLAHDATMADRDQASEAIGAAVNRTTALIKQLLVLGRRDLRAPRALSLRDFVRDQQRTLQQLLPDDIAVAVEGTDDVWCMIDEAQAHQVLLNLVVNGRDAIGHGGTLVIRVAPRRLEAPQSAVHGEVPPGAWAMLEVEDDGPGMGDETRRHAFEPFFTTKADGKGTGLGLPTVAAIAAASGGHVQLDSAPLRGTRVTILLPQISAVPRQPDAAAAGDPDLRGTSVLLVEDDAPVRDIAQRALELAGADVRVASDGDEALAQVTDGSFHVLCIDAVMPGAPVAQVVAAFRRAQPGAGVLVCSAHVREDLVRRGIEEGHVDFLPKPYDPATLVRSVAAARSAVSA